MNALERLLQGNREFANPAGDVLRNRRIELAENGQHPFATVVCCSDSRVPPELIFGCGLGDLFVIRVAGNVIGEDELASISYATHHLHTELTLILGHTHCGAVGAALEGCEEKELAPLMDKIHCAICDEHDAKEASKKNAIAGAKLVRERLGLSEFECMAALYDIESGQVEIL